MDVGSIVILAVTLVSEVVMGIASAVSNKKQTKKADAQYAESMATAERQYSASMAASAALESDARAYYAQQQRQAERNAYLARYGSVGRGRPARKNDFAMPSEFRKKAEALRQHQMKLRADDQYWREVNEQRERAEARTRHSRALAADDARWRSANKMRETPWAVTPADRANVDKLNSLKAKAGREAKPVESVYQSNRFPNFTE